jgi:hypothetical protein
LLQSISAMAIKEAIANAVAAANDMAIIVAGKY